MTAAQAGQAKVDAHAIVFEGKPAILDDYAGKDAILAKLYDAFHAGVEALEGKAAREAVEKDGLRNLHKHFPAAKVALLEDFILRRIRDDLYFWVQQVGRETIGLADPFYIDMLIVMRVHYPHLIARSGGATIEPETDWAERIRLITAGLRNPTLFTNQINRRIRKRAKMKEHAITYSAKATHGDLPTLARAHAAHIDTWYGHSFDGFNVWLSIDGVNKDNTVILYPELWGHKVDYDPVSMYLAAGINLPKPTKVELRPGQLLLFNPETLHGTQVNISEETRVALTLRVNPKTPRFNDDAPFNPEHWFSSVDLAKREFGKIHVFPADKHQGAPSVAQVPVPPDPHTKRVTLAEAVPASGEVVIGSADLLGPGDKLGVDAPNLKLVVVRSADGLRAYDRRCPHRGIDIIDGAHDGDQIFCPGHGIAFALTNGKSSCAAFHLRGFEVFERGGMLVLRRAVGADAEAMRTAAE